MFRILYFPRTGIPFSKPRFIYKNNRLQLINSPVVSLDRIIPTLYNFDHFPYAEYEPFCNKDVFKKSFYLKLRASQFLKSIYLIKSSTKLKSSLINEDDINLNPLKTSYYIIHEFYNTIKEDGGIPYVIIFPLVNSEKQL
jgi:hypothetical protein